MKFHTSRLLYEGVWCVVKASCGKKGKRKVKGLPQSQTAALLRHQEEEETDKIKQAQIEQTYEKHQDQLSLPQVRY